MTTDIEDLLERLDAMSDGETTVGRHRNADLLDEATALIRRLIEAHEWRPIDTAPDSRNVLVTYINPLGKPRIVKAIYVTQFSIEQEPEDDGFELDYHEERDAHYLPEGWYEVCDNHDEYGYFAITNGEPTHWMPLPAFCLENFDDRA